MKTSFRRRIFDPTAKLLQSVDDITLNAGSGGSVVATDEAAGGEHYQVVKLADGTANSTTHIPLSGDLTNGLDVDVTRVGGTVTVDLSTNNDVQGMVAEGAAVGGTQPFLMAGDDGTNVKHVAVDASGNLQVDLVTADVTNAGTFAVQATQAGTWNVGTVTAVTDITNTVTVDNGGTFAVQAAIDELPAAAAASDNFANPTTTNIISMSMVWDGATWDRVPGNATDGVLVNLGTNNDISGTVTANAGTGTFTVDGSGVTQPVSGTVTANAGTGSWTVDLGTNNDVTVTGGNAHDGTTLGNPVLGGARATNSIEGVTQVANADLTYVQADLNGVLISRPHTTLEEIITERVANTNGTSTDLTNFAAGGAGVHNYVTTISIYNSSATDGYVDFRDGSAGSIIFTAAAPAAGGSIINLPVPLKGAANTALAYDVSGALSTVYISVVGFQAQG